MKNKSIILKSSQGITLIALVITIVVLLILAGISINAIIGNNGIFTRAKKGATDYSIEAYEEQINIAKSGIDMDEIINATTDEKYFTSIENALKANSVFKNAEYDSTGTTSERKEEINCNN